MTTMPAPRYRRLVATALGVAAPCSLVGACGESVIVAEAPLAIASADAGPPPSADASGDATPDGSSFLVCGGAICRNGLVPSSGITAYACCASVADSKCGFVELNSCLETAQPGALDPACPTLPATPLGTLPGCCRPDGTCGVFDESLGLGCVSVPLLSQVSPCTPRQ
jgi:hypothetical protein